MEWLAGVLEQNGSFYIGPDGHGRARFVFMSVHADVVRRVAALLPWPVSAREIQSGWGDQPLFRVDASAKDVPQWFLDNVVPYLTASRAAAVQAWARRAGLYG